MPSKIPYDCVEVMRDMMVRWSDKVPYKMKHKNYFQIKNAAEATNELNATITTLMSEYDDEDFSTSGAIASYVLRVTSFISSHMKNAGTITFVGIKGNQLEVDLLIEVMSLLGFKAKITAEDQGGYLWWLWERKRPGVPIKIELTLYQSIDKASPSRLEQNLAIKESQSRTPHYRRMALLTCPRPTREKLYISVERAMRNNTVRAEKKGYKPEQPFTGMINTPNNAAFVSYFDGDTSKLR